MATRGYKRRHGLTVKQLNAIDLLVHGKTDQEVADLVGVHRVTVTKWRNADPWFQAALNEQRLELWGSSLERVRSLLPLALDAVEGQLKSGGAGSASVGLSLLKLSGLLGCTDLSKVGPTNADTIIDSLARARRPNPLAEEYAALLGEEPVSDIEREAVLSELTGTSG